MDLRHKIDNEYNSDPRHIKQWDMTIEWLEQFNIKGQCLDCGDKTDFTDMIDYAFVDIDVIYHTTQNLNWGYGRTYRYCLNNAFAFEIIEHLLNPLTFMIYLKNNVSRKGFVYLSTPINRPNWIRNKDRHFHEFNYNELMHLIDEAGFKVVDEKIINPSVKWWTGFRPFLRKFFSCGNNILLRLKRK